MVICNLISNHKMKGIFVHISAGILELEELLGDRILADVPEI